MELVQPYGEGNEVTSINTLTGDVILAAGTGITLTPVGNTITISSTSGFGHTIFSEVVAGSGTTFTLAHTPIGNILLIGNGQVLTLTNDFTVAGAIITTLTSWSAGQILASYNY